jgi:hypothetical protein
MSQQRVFGDLRGFLLKPAREDYLLSVMNRANVTAPLES